MDSYSKLDDLISLSEETGIRIRRVPGSGDGFDHPGGAVVRLKGEQVLFLDPLASVEDQIDAAVRALRQRPELENRYLPPEIRELLEEDE